MGVPFEGSKFVQRGDQEDVGREQVEPMGGLARLQGHWQSIVDESGMVSVSESTKVSKVLSGLPWSQDSKSRKLPMSPWMS